MTRYQQLADELIRMMDAGVLRPGERLPSVRHTATRHGLSPGTVVQAYAELERRGRVDARPRSGHYVRPRPAALLPEPETAGTRAEPARVDVSETVFRVLAAIRDGETVPLGSSFPSPGLFPLDDLASAMGRAVRRMAPNQSVVDLPPGNAALRRLIARRYLELGAPVSPAEIVITNGAMEAFNLALQAVTRPGDMVAIEHPSFYAVLQAVERLGLRAVPIRTHPRHGVELPDLADALARLPIRACVLMADFHNPLGALMPDAARRDLLALLARHDVPLVEDGVYQELYFGPVPPRPLKAEAGAERVLHCGSFSKSLAPGYRIGWVAAGRYAEAVCRLQLATSLCASVPGQAALARYLAESGMTRHLRRLRGRLADQQRSLMDAVARHFPDGTRMTRPEGGYFLWVELPPGSDALAVHHAALARGISTMPGPLFSARRDFTHCLRLNYGHPWGARLEAGVALLGACARQDPAALTSPGSGGAAWP